MLSENNKLLVSGSFDYTTKIWSILNHKLIRSMLEAKFSKRRPVNFAAINRSGNIVITGGFNASMTKWSVNSGQILGIFIGHDSFIWHLLINEEKNIVISGSWDSTIKIWSLNEL